MGDNAAESGTRSAPQPVKVCISCGVDVSQKPRTRDSKGRYSCAACVEKLKAAKSVSKATQVAASEAAEEPELSIDLLQEEAKASASVRADTVIDLAPAPVERQTKLTRVSQLDRLAGPRSCVSCGYDLKGVAGFRCPECGTINPPRDDKRAQLEQESRELVRKTWLTPIIVTVSCLLLTALGLSLVKASLGVFLVVFVGWLVMIPIGMLAFWVSTLMFLDFDAPWGLTALRYAQIQAMLTLPVVLWAALGFRPGGFNILGLGAGLALMTFLFAWILELDTVDAILLAVVQKVVEVVSLIALAALIGAILGA